MMLGLVESRFDVPGAVEAADANNDGKISYQWEAGQILKHLKGNQRKEFIDFIDQSDKNSAEVIAKLNQIIGGANHQQNQLASTLEWASGWADASRMVTLTDWRQMSLGQLRKLAQKSNWYANELKNHGGNSAPAAAASSSAGWLSEVNSDYQVTSAEADAIANVFNSAKWEIRGPGVLGGLGAKGILTMRLHNNDDSQKHYTVAKRTTDADFRKMQAAFNNMVRGARKPGYKLVQGPKIQGQQAVAPRRQQVSPGASPWEKFTIWKSCTFNWKEIDGNMKKAMMWKGHWETFQYNGEEYRISRTHNNQFVIQDTHVAYQGHADKAADLAREWRLNKAKTVQEASFEVEYFFKEQWMDVTYEELKNMQVRWAKSEFRGDAMKAMNEHFSVIDGHLASPESNGPAIIRESELLYNVLEKIGTLNMLKFYENVYDKNGNMLTAGWTYFDASTNLDQISAVNWRMRRAHNQVKRYGILYCFWHNVEQGRKYLNYINSLTNAAWRAPGTNIAEVRRRQEIFATNNPTRICNELFGWDQTAYQTFMDRVDNYNRKVQAGTINPKAAWNVPREKFSVCKPWDISCEVSVVIKHVEEDHNGDPTRVGTTPVDGQPTIVDTKPVDATPAPEQAPAAPATFD